MRYAIKLQITEPCSVKWTEMVPRDAGSYCRNCQKTVVDFSAMSDKEIFDHMHRAGTSVCGRFKDDQLNRVLQPAAAPSSIVHRKKFWQLLVAGSLFAHQTKSQEAPRVTSPISQAVVSNDLVTLGDGMYQVIDGTTKQPLSGATVVIDGVDITTNDQGVFRLAAGNRELRVSFVGYQEREFRLRNGRLPKQIELDRKVEVLEEVSVTGFVPISAFSGMVGGVGFSRVVTPFQKAVRALDQWIPDPAVKIFPNPLTTGQHLNVQFDLSKPGNYVLKIIAADGRLMDVQTLQITSKKQAIQLPVSSKYASGVYWLSVHNIVEKRQHEIKFVIR